MQYTVSRIVRKIALIQAFSTFLAFHSDESRKPAFHAYQTCHSDESARPHSISTIKTVNSIAQRQFARDRSERNMKT